MIPSVHLSPVPHPPLPWAQAFSTVPSPREEAGSGLSDYGLSAVPTYGWGRWSLLGDNRLVFLTPHSVRRGTKWVEEAGVEASELSFFL